MTLLDEHWLHAIPLAVPVVAVAVVLGPDAVRWCVRRMRAAGQPAAVVCTAGAAAASAGAIHLLVMPHHLEHHVVAGLFFLAAGLGQLLLAGWLLVFPRRPLLRLAVLGNTAMVLLWLQSRTVGLPVGSPHGGVEPVGGPDLLAVTAEIVLVTASLVALRRSVQVGEPAAHRPAHRHGQPEQQQRHQPSAQVVLPG